MVLRRHLKSLQGEDRQVNRWWWWYERREKIGKGKIERDGEESREEKDGG